MAQARDYLFSDGEWKNVSSMTREMRMVLRQVLRMMSAFWRNHGFGGSPQSKWPEAEPLFKTKLPRVTIGT